MAGAEPARELTDVLAGQLPGRALDLASGAGRHAMWLAGRGWDVTAVDWTDIVMPGVRFIKADLEKHEFPIEAASWDLIVCWLYWQPDLVGEIARGVRPGGIAALSGKTSGRFATSLANFRASLAGWEEIASGEADHRAWLIARAPLQ